MAYRYVIWIFCILLIYYYDMQLFFLISTFLTVKGLPFELVVKFNSSENYCNLQIGIILIFDVYFYWNNLFFYWTVKYYLELLGFVSYPKFSIKKTIVIAQDSKKRHGKVLHRQLHWKAVSWSWNLKKEGEILNLKDTPHKIEKRRSLILQEVQGFTAHVTKVYIGRHQIRQCLVKRLYCIKLYWYFSDFFP